MRGIEKLKAKSYLPSIVAAAVFTLGFIAMSSAGGQSSSADGSSEPVRQGPLVETVIPKVVDGKYKVHAPGRLQSRQNLSVVAEVSGKVTVINPKFVRGGRFEEGETLFKINSADYEADLARGEAAVASAEAAFVRATLENDRRLDLVKQGAVSEAAKDETVANLASAKASLSQAKAQLRQAQENLSRTHIRAPFPALVASEDVSLDTYVAPGQVLATLIDTRAAEIVAGLSPEKAAAVSRMLARSEGKLIATARPNDGSVGSATLDGFVDQFSPSIDEASRSALVVAVFPDAFSPENKGRIFANDFMTLEVTVQSSKTVWQVPAGVVRKGSFVWLIKDGVLRKQDVTVFDAGQEHALITSVDGLDGVQVLLTLLSEEAEGLAVRTTAYDAQLASK